jgi:glucose/arabinose dehydrogenase/chitodextrinase
VSLLPIRLKASLHSMVLAGLLMAAAGIAVAQTGTLPPGFEEVEVASGLSMPMGLAFAPDERLFITEKEGAVRVFSQGQLLETPLLRLSVPSDSELGFMGIALDPDFESNFYLYLFYTAGSRSLRPPASPRNRISRFTVEGDEVLPGSETILLDGIPTKGWHNGGCLAFGQDGKLYISTGDGGTPSNSQSVQSLAGKILRINRDGTIPADNPFIRQAQKRGEVYCYGLRNPWRFHFRPGTNTFYIGDVGEDDWEEVNAGQAGGNYGWPTYEGAVPAAGYVNPFYAYPHNGVGASITGGCFVTNREWPAGYRDAYYFGDYVNNAVGRLVLNGNGTLNSAHDFGAAASPVAFMEGPDGDLYYLSIGTGTLRKFRYVGVGNRQPTARAAASGTSGPAPLTVQFSSAGSGDPDGDPLSFLWTFGDGATSSQANPVHTYSGPGGYTVQLQVSDGRGGVSQAASLRIDAGNGAPVVRITSPADESLYNAGDTIRFAGTAEDPEEGSLPGSRMRWTVLFYHSDHTHPFLENTGSSSGSFVVPRTGESSADTWYEIRLTATDSRGASSTSTVQIRPRKVQLTLRTQPDGLDVTVNGQIQTTPLTFSSVIGFEHRIAAPSPQKRNGSSYAWRSWSDRGTREHTIRTPATDTTWTAAFRKSAGARSRARG